MFLNKIAHEFKNPLICIGELVELINEEKNFSRSDRSYKFLQQIKSFSDYLLLLTVDLNYVCQDCKEPQVKEFKEIDLNDIDSFCDQVGNLLLIKFNKNLKFKIENSIDLPILVQIDEIKLKQVLINLISNSVKFTNTGEIRLIIKY